jgi:hypothetical protein
MWLTLGRDCAGADEPWVKPVYDSAFPKTTQRFPAASQYQCFRSFGD